MRIGDDWNAISIIALAQSNPLKAVAEFVENSIDAGARNVNIVRGREKGEPYLLISDDGTGVRRNSDGTPDFRYVATHICDSFKRRLKADGVNGIQGEFGIGLLSFWTLGEDLFMTCASEDGTNYQMHMERDDPSYQISRLRTLAPVSGTELKVKPLLPGIRGFSGERLEWFLASELRDRIRSTGVKIRVTDRQARKEFIVKPRQFDGTLIKELPSVATPTGNIYLELYLTDSGQGEVSLSRSGTRVLSDIGTLEGFAGSVWQTGVVEGVIDVPFLTLTPGTRSGLIRDAAFNTFYEAIAPVAGQLAALVEAHRQAEAEKASERMLKRLQRAFREAILSLSSEEYDWFDIRREVESNGSTVQDQTIEGDPDSTVAVDENGAFGTALRVDDQRHRHQEDFFDYPGPMFSVRISPQSSVIAVGQTQSLRALCRDKSRRIVDRDVVLEWRILDGTAVLSDATAEIVTVSVSNEPGMVRVGVTAVEGDAICESEAVITVTDELVVGRSRRSEAGKGLPGYTFFHAPGSLWRSRYDSDENLIVVNNGHRDFVYANRNNALKLRYVARLFAKELVQKNFPGASAEEALERMIELTLYMEENLR